MITVVSRPDLFSAVYKDVTYQFTSDKSPATGDFVAQINTISQATVFDFGLIPETTKVQTLTAIEDLTEGGFVEISGTINGRYQGVFRVVGIKTGDPTSFTIDTEFVGDDFNGDAKNFFKDYSIVANVFTDGGFSFQTRAQHDSDGVFSIRLADNIKNLLGSDVLQPETTAILDAINTCKPYYIEYTEEFVVRNANGIDKIVQQDIISDQQFTNIAVNATAPKAFIKNHQIISTAGNLDKYVIDGIQTAQFLSNQPLTKIIGSDEDYQLTTMFRQSVNLFPDGDNGTMETDVTGMIVGANSSEVVQSDLFPFSGLQSARVQCSGSAFFALTDILRHSTAVTLDANTTYIVTMRVSTVNVKPQLPIELFVGTLLGSGVPTVVSKFEGIDFTNKAYIDVVTSFTIGGVAALDTFVLFLSTIPGQDLSNESFYVDEIIVSKVGIEYDRRARFFDNTGGLLGTDLDTMVINSDKCVNMPVGTSNLTLPVNTVQYIVDVFDGASAVTEEIVFNVNPDCRNTEQRFVFLNLRSGADAFTFIGMEEEGVEVRQETYKRLLGTNPSVEDGQVITTFTEANDIFTVNSGLITKDTSQWLKELIHSPEIYVILDNLESGGKEKMLISVRQGSFAISNSVDNLFNVTFSYRFSVDKPVQTN